jgi:hypothetical protein
MALVVKGPGGIQSTMFAFVGDLAQYRGREL